MNSSQWKYIKETGILKLQTINKKNMPFSQDTVFIIVSYLQVPEMCQSLLVCKEWHSLRELEVFWQQAFLNLLQYELEMINAQQQNNKQGESRKRQIAALRERHIVRQFYKQKGTKFQQIVTKQYQGFKTMAHEKHFKNVLTKKISRASKFADFMGKWNTVLELIAQGTVQEKWIDHHNKSMLYTLCENFYSLKQEQQQGQGFLDLYARIKSKYPNQHLAQICTSTQAVFGYPMPFLLLLGNEQVVLSLVEQFIKDLELVPLSEQPLLRDGWSLYQAVVQRKGSSKTMHAILKYKLHKHSLLFANSANAIVAPLMSSIAKSSYEDTTTLLMQEYFADWDKIQHHGDVLGSLLRNTPDSQYIDDMLNRMNSPITVSESHNNVMTEVVYVFNRTTEERFIQVCSKLMQLGCSFADKTSSMYAYTWSASLYFVSYIKSDTEPAKLLRALEFMKPYIDVNETTPNGGCYLTSMQFEGPANLVLLEWLLKLGCNPNHISADGYTPMFSIPMSDERAEWYIQFFDMFGKYGADFTILNQQGTTIVQRCELYAPNKLAPMVKNLAITYGNNSKTTTTTTIE